MRCANCGGSVDEGKALCEECWGIPVTDGSTENIAAWYAWSRLINGEWSIDEIRQFADAPAVQGLVRRLIAAMELRKLFVSKESEKYLIGKVGGEWKSREA